MASNENKNTGRHIALIGSALLHFLLLLWLTDVWQEFRDATEPPAASINVQLQPQPEPPQPEPPQPESPKPQQEQPEQQKPQPKDSELQEEADEDYFASEHTADDDGSVVNEEKKESKPIVKGDKEKGKSTDAEKVAEKEKAAAEGEGDKKEAAAAIKEALLTETEKEPEQKEEAQEGVKGAEKEGADGITNAKEAETATTEVDSSGDKKESFEDIPGARATVNIFAKRNQRKIYQNWTPPRIRGQKLRATVFIELTETGELEDVRIVESSGNKEFDRSIVIAVMRVRKFDMPVKKEIAAKARRIRMVLSAK